MANRPRIAYALRLDAHKMAAPIESSRPPPAEVGASGREAFNYSAFGLPIRSELELPELAPAPRGADPVEFRLGKTPKELIDVVQRGGAYAAGPGRFLLHIEKVGRFLVEGGRRILVERADGASDDDLRVFLLGSSLGALLHQRGILALHASAVVVNGGAVLFAGVSGAGKSTLAAAFARRGHAALADDVSALTVDRKGCVVAHPGLRRFKLWRDAVLTLRYDPAHLPHVRPATLNRFSVPIDRLCDAAVPLRAIFVLLPWNQDSFEHYTVGDSRRFAVVVAHTYRARFVQGLGVQAPHFALATALSRQAPVHVLRRPDGPIQLEPLVSLVEEQLA